jgi:arylformamidase
MLPGHSPDPDAIPSTNPAVLDYIARVTAAGGTGPVPTHHLRYGPDRGQWLEVYAPPGATGRPVLLFFHGGYWINGHLGWLRFMAGPALANGFVFVAGTYRLAPRCPWPAQLDDVAAAIRFVADHASAWGGDPDRIVAGGHSAGGQLTMLAALTRPGPKLAGLAPVSGLFDLRFGDVPLESEQGRVYKYLFADRHDDAGASPLLFLDRLDTPVHLMWGDRDLPDSITSSRAVIDQLEAAGKPVSWTELPNASHFDAHLSLADLQSAWWQAINFPKPD